MVFLELILKEKFPELEVGYPFVPGTSNITQVELVEAIQYIRDNKLVQDSANLLSSTQPLRSSVSYPIVFPNQRRELEFTVDWIQGPNVFVGYV